MNASNTLRTVLPLCALLFAGCSTSSADSDLSDDENVGQDEAALTGQNASVTSYTPPGPKLYSLSNTYPVSVTVKNTGTTTWVQASPSATRHVVQLKALDTLWGVTTRSLPTGAVIAPGASYTFSFNVIAGDLKAKTAKKLQFQMLDVATGATFGTPTLVNAAIAHPTANGYHYGYVTGSAAPPPATPSPITLTQALGAKNTLASAKWTTYPYYATTAVAWPASPPTLCQSGTVAYRPCAPASSPNGYTATGFKNQIYVQGSYCYCAL